MATGGILHTLTGHTGIVFAVAYAPDGRTLATGSDDDTARIWDVATGKTLKTLGSPLTPYNLDWPTGHSDSVQRWRTRPTVKPSPPGATT